MVNLKLKLKNKQQKTLTASTGKMVRIAYTTQYALGDFYELEAGNYPIYVWVQLEPSLSPSLLYLTNKWTFKIPFNIEREWPYPTSAFIGRRHYAWAKPAEPEEIDLKRNLALNTYDQHEFSNAYPHAEATVETDNNPVFFARNAIDGVQANGSHGSYPFQSWGIGNKKDAEFKLSFGRPVDLSIIKLVLRADYPHDTNWDKAKLIFSNGSTRKIKFIHTADPQIFKILERKITWLKLTNLECAPQNKGYTALTQIEAWGKPCVENLSNQSS